MKNKFIFVCFFQFRVCVSTKYRLNFVYGIGRTKKLEMFAFALCNFHCSVFVLINLSIMNSDDSIDSEYKKEQHTNI